MHVKRLAGLFALILTAAGAAVQTPKKVKLKAWRIVTLESGRDSCTLVVADSELDDALREARMVSRRKPKMNWQRFAAVVVSPRVQDDAFPLRVSKGEFTGDGLLIPWYADTSTTQKRRYIREIIRISKQLDIPIPPGLDTSWMNPITPPNNLPRQEVNRPPPPLDAKGMPTVSVGGVLRQTLVIRVPREFLAVAIRCQESVLQ